VTPFDTAAFDLNEYLARIALDRRPARPDLASLRDLTLAHPCAIPFENLNPLLRRPVRLDIASIQEKLVRGGRGGWCFEHNLLLGTALTSLGYTVTGLSARVVWNVPAGVVRGRSHMVLLVALPEGPHIVDVGFGGSTPTAPLRLEAGIEQATPHEPFRLTQVDGGLMLEARIETSWKGLYIFDLQPQALADYELPNWYLCNHPGSQFVKGLVCARAAPDKRHALRNTRYAVHRPDGSTERRLVVGIDELTKVWRADFQLAVPESRLFDEKAAAMIAANP